MSEAFIPHNRPTEPPVDDNIINYDPFYPNFSLIDYRRIMRQDDTVTDTRLRENIILAMVMINGLLSDWRSQQLGINKLTNAQKILLYKHAVYSRAKTYLIEKYIDIDTTHNGEDSIGSRQSRINSRQARIDTERKNEREFIRQLINKPRTTITLV